CGDALGTTRDHRRKLILATGDERLVAAPRGAQPAAPLAIVSKMELHRLKRDIPPFAFRSSSEGADAFLVGRNPSLRKRGARDSGFRPRRFEQGEIKPVSRRDYSFLWYTSVLKQLLHMARDGTDVRPVRHQARLEDSPLPHLALAGVYVRLRV